MVPISRFENVCDELDNALKREQQAQALLHEQTAQMQEMGERLELHANQGEEKDVTLAEAVKVVIIPTLVRVFLCPYVSPFSLVELTLTWFIWGKNLELHITLIT